MGDFPCIPPIVSFTGLVVGTGHSSLRRDLLPGLDAAQLNCCGFVRLSTYVAPGMPNKVPFKGFHPFQVFVIFPIRANPWAVLCRKMAERQDSQFQPNVPFTCTGKVAGLLRHDVMLYPPGSYRDNVFIVVPDSWTFLDKAAAAVTTMAPLLSTPQRQQASSASAAFQDMRAASLSLITPGTLRPVLHLWLRLRPRPATLRRPGNDIALSLPIRRRSDRSFSVSAASAAHEPDNLNRVLTYGTLPSIPLSPMAWARRPVPFETATYIRKLRKWNSPDCPLVAVTFLPLLSFLKALCATPVGLPLPFARAAAGEPSPPPRFVRLSSHARAFRNHAHYYTDWTTTTFTKLRMDNANATRSLQEVLQLLFDKLQRNLLMKIEHALFKPSNKIEALFADLRSSIETHLARGTTPQYAQDDNQQYYLDRRYNNNRERGSGYRGSRDFRCQSYNRGRFNQRPQGNNNRPWTRKCFVCNKEGCWSIKHTAEERQKAKSQYVAHCHFTGTPVELAAYVTDYEGIEGDPADDDGDWDENQDDDANPKQWQASQMLCQQAFNHLITGEDAYRTDQNTVPASQFVIEDRYSKDKFQGIMIDTGAAKVSTAGHSHLDSSKSGQATIKFGNGEAIHSVNSIALKTPVGRITFHILQTPTPFLLSLADMDRLGIYFNNIKDTIECTNHCTNRQMSIPVTQAEIRTLHRRFGHPAVPRLYHLLKQAGHSDVSIGTLETVSKFCHHCQMHSQAPRRFKFTLKDDQEFNYEIIVDVMYLGSPQRPVLHVVDAATAFQGARFLPSMSAKDTWETLRTAWIDTYLGPPDTIRHDAGTNFASMEFRQEAKLMGIKCSQVPVETHWSIGKIERYHAPLRRAYDILNAELSNVTSAEAVLQMAVKAINDTAGPDGIVPTLLVFGAYPRLTAESPPSASTLKRSAAMQKAMKTLRQLSAERQVKDALRTRNGPSTADVLSSHCKVKFVFERKDGWQGPFKIASIDGHNVTIDTVNGPKSFVPRTSCPAQDEEETLPDLTPAPRKRTPTRIQEQAKGFDHDDRSSRPKNEGIITAPGAPFEESDNIEITDLVGRGVFSFERYDRMIHGNHHIFRSRMVREVKGKDTKPYEKSRLVVQGHSDFEKTTLLTQSPTIQRVTYPQSQTELFRTILTYLPTELQGKYPHGTIIRVIKPLYGIAEAGVHWYRTYQQHHLKNLDMSTSTYDSCLLITNTGPNTFGIVGMQTDDTLMLGTDSFSAREEEKLEEAQFRAKPKTSMTPGTTVDFNGAKLTLLDIGSLSLQQKGQATKIATIDPKAFDHSQRYVEQRARGSYMLHCYTGTSISTSLINLSFARLIHHSLSRGIFGRILSQDSFCLPVNLG
ncbi:integrase core domain-containing protein [Hirsutella rhossiliensis]